jgi:hypothetical protein
MSGFACGREEAAHVGANCSSALTSADAPGGTEGFQSVSVDRASRCLCPDRQHRVISLETLEGRSQNVENDPRTCSL